MLKKLFVFSIGPVFSALIGIVSTPLTSWLVAPSEFALASMFSLFVSLSNASISLGMEHAFAREYNLASDKLRLFNNIVLLPYIGSIILSLLLMLNYHYITSALFGYPSLLLTILLIICIVLSVINCFFSNLLRMQERARSYSSRIIIYKLIHFVSLILILLFFKRSGESIIIASVIAEIANSTLLLSANPSFAKLTLENIDLKLIKKCLKYGLPMVPTFLLTWAFNSMDKVMLRSFASYRELGVYAASFKFVSALTILQTAFSSYWLPTSYRWHEEGVSPSKYGKVSNAISVLLFFLAGIVVILRFFISWLLSPDYSEASRISIFLIFPPILTTISYTTISGIDFKRKTYLHIIIAGVSAGTNFILNWFLIPSYGALGAAAATSISATVLFWMRTLISRRLWLHNVERPYAAPA